MDSGRPATVVAIGIHPFVVGTPAGAAAMRRVLENLKAQELVWLTDVEAILRAAGQSFWSRACQCAYRSECPLPGILPANPVAVIAALPVSSGSPRRCR